MNKELTPLDAFKRIVIYNDLENPVRGQTDEIDIVKSALEENKYLKEQNKYLGSRLNRKKLKALEIIKEKGIILQFIKETYTVEQYNAGVFGTLVKPLTKEEYELLKEVLL